MCLIKIRQFVASLAASVLDPNLISTVSTSEHIAKHVRESRQRAVAERWWLESTWGFF